MVVTWFSDGLYHHVARVHGQSFVLCLVGSTRSTAVEELALDQVSRRVDCIECLARLVKGR